MRRCICVPLIIFLAASGAKLSASIIGDDVEFSRYYPPWYSTHNDYHSEGWATVAEPGMEFIIAMLDNTCMDRAG